MINKRSILDRLASGEIKLSTEAQVKADPEYQAGIEATIRFMEETQKAANTGLRKAGRPLKTAPRRVTEVRSLRLEVNLWLEMEKVSDQIGCSINRYIEEAIYSRLNDQGEAGGPLKLQTIGDWDMKAYQDIPLVAANVFTFVPNVA